MQKLIRHFEDRVAHNKTFLNGIRVEYTIRAESLSEAIDVIINQGLFSLQGFQRLVDNEIFVLHTPVENYFRNANLALKMLEMVVSSITYRASGQLIYDYIGNFFMVVGNALGWCHRWSVAFKEGFPMNREAVWFRNMNTLSNYMITMFSERKSIIQFPDDLIYYLMTTVDNLINL